MSEILLKKKNGKAPKPPSPKAHRFVKFIFENSKMTTEELATKSGVGRGAFCRWKTGTFPKLFELEAVLQAIGYDLAVVRKHAPHSAFDGRGFLVEKVMEILANNDRKKASAIVAEIGEFFETQACLDLTSELQYITNEHYKCVKQINALHEQIAEQKYSPFQRESATQVIRDMEIGETKFIETGNSHAKIAKKFSDCARIAKMKIERRALIKDGIMGIEIRRVL